MSTTFHLPASFRLGIIGGGQLARMSAMQAFRFGIQVGAVCSPSGNDPMEQVTPHIFRGDMSDYDTLMQLADWADVITLENEFLDAGLLKKVMFDSVTPVFPSPESFRLIENKRIEKETFRNAGIPVAAFQVVATSEDLHHAGQQLGWPFILKSSKGGYDGYGNKHVSGLDEAKVAFRELGGDKGHEVIAERLVPFTRELAVMVARNEHGTVIYPCCETVQENHICTRVYAPARIHRSVREKCEKLAGKAAEAISGKGLFGFEFFLTEQGELLLNESAPRPHNSGHFSIEACSVSQFENHVRSVCGLPLVQPHMRYPAAVMINLLGKNPGDAMLQLTDYQPDDCEVHIHAYGKSKSRKGRKMGHITVLGSHMEIAEKRALEAAGVTAL